MGWIETIAGLTEQKIKDQDYESAAQFREIERYLKYNHSIEEIFEAKLNYNKIVQKELVKLERKKKLYKIEKNN